MSKSKYQVKDEIYSIKCDSIPPFGIWPLTLDIFLIPKKSGTLLITPPTPPFCFLHPNYNLLDLAGKPS